MPTTSEYKRSLKSVEAEEILDLYIFRPISFVFVKLIYNTNITPNQISIIALAFGVLSGLLYANGTHEFFILASASFFICNTLDCADGQLARLKNNGTRIGRIIDGFIDYITSISIFLGLGIALTGITGNPFYSWGLTIAAGFSKAVQNMAFDFYRNMYLEHVYGKVSNINNEMNEFREYRESIKKEGGSKFNIFLINLYLLYAGMQKNSNGVYEISVKPEQYKKKNERLLRMWSWLGSTTHMIFLMVFSVLFMVEVYLILTITLGNLMLIIFYLRQKSIIKSLSLQIA